MVPEDDWFDSAIEAAFESPQAKLVRERLAAAEAAKAADRKMREFERQRNKPSPVEALAAARELNAVIRGERPMHTPGPSVPPGWRPKGSSGRIERVDPPRPGGTGAISNKMAIEAIVTNIKAAKDPRAAASEMLTSITAELIKIVQTDDE